MLRRDADSVQLRQAFFQRLKIWKSSPAIEQSSIEKFQDILVQGHVLDEGKRVKYQDLVVAEYAAKAK